MKDLIKISDLSKLEVHQAYILLSESEVALTKTILDIIERPKALNAEFINNPEIQEIKKKRMNNWDIKEINKSCADKVLKEKKPVSLENIRIQLN